MHVLQIERGKMGRVSSLHVRSRHRTKKQAAWMSWTVCRKMPPEPLRDPPSRSCSPISGLRPRRHQALCVCSRTCPSTLYASTLNLHCHFGRKSIRSILLRVPLNTKRPLGANVVCSGPISGTCASQLVHLSSPLDACHDDAGTSSYKGYVSHRLDCLIARTTIVSPIPDPIRPS
jgi:hypothetical protein